MLRWASETPDAPALIGPDETLSYKQLAWRAEKFAAQLARDGVGQDDIVMVRMPKGFDFVFTLALSMLGATAVSNTAKQYYDFEPQTDWLVTRQQINDYPPQKQIVITPPWQQRAFNNLEAYFPAGMKTPESLARIALTSGTTGRPKAVAISQKNLIDRLAIFEREYPHWGYDYYLSDMGTIGGGLKPMLLMKIGWAVIHFGPKKSPDDIIALSLKYPPTHIAGSTVQAEQFLAYFLRTKFDFSKLKTLRIGGSTVPIRLQQLVARQFGFPLQISYGSTEAGFGSTRLANEELPAQNIGLPFPGSDFQIVDESHEPLPVGRVGVLRFRTDHMATGYWKNPVASGESFRDGWFYPGDLGCINPDGSIELGGRFAEIINLGGVKIDPYLIDELAISELAVTEAASFGFVDKSGSHKLGVAVCGVGAGSLKTKGFEKALARKYPISGNIYYLFLSELPRNGMAKVERSTLASLAASRQ